MKEENYLLKFRADLLPSSEAPRLGALLTQDVGQPHNTQEHSIALRAPTSTRVDNANYYLYLTLVYI